MSHALRGVLTQLQVVHALLLREVKTRFGEYQLGYGWALLEPMLWVATFLGMYYALGRTAPYGLSAFDFLVTGIVPFLAFRNTVRQAGAGISGNSGLLFYPQVRPLDLVASRVLLETVTQFLVFVLLMGGAVLVQGTFRIDNILEVLTGYFLAAGLGCSLGLVVCGLSVFSPTVERIQGPILRPLFWLSGVFYSVDAMPSPLRKLVLMNPVSHAIELVRHGWFPGYVSRSVSVLYPAAWILVLLFFGLSLERVARRRLELT